MTTKSAERAGQTDAKSLSIRYEPPREPAMSAALPAFDTLLEMAREDPEGLERLRQSLCEEVIRRTPDTLREERLRRLLWRIDSERRRARTPLGACLRMSTLMQDALHRLNAAFNDPYPPEQGPSARILPFQR